jgi:hypothetical protein
LKSIGVKFLLKMLLQKEPKSLLLYMPEPENRFIFDHLNETI